MDLWQLKVFCSVVEAQSFSKAGYSIHLSQPTVSSHIKDLEDHFGCRLIDRMARQAVPTKAGELLYDYARRLLALRDETETALAEFQGKLKGRLYIGGSTIPGGYILPKVIGDFKKKHPDILVTLKIGDTDEIIDDTISGGVEIGIVGAETSDPAIVQQKLFADRLCLAVPGHHRWVKRRRIRLKELLSEPFIIREAGSGTRKSIQINLAKSGLRLDDFNIVAEMGSTHAVISGISSGLGVSILSSLAIATEATKIGICALDVEGLDLRRNFYLTLRRRRTLSPLAEAFIEVLNISSTLAEAVADQNAN